MEFLSLLRTVLPDGRVYKSKGSPVRFATEQELEAQKTIFRKDWLDRKTIPAVGELKMDDMKGHALAAPVLLFCSKMATGLHEDLSAGLKPVADDDNEGLINYSTLVVYLDVLCAAFLAGHSPSSIRLGLRKRDGLPVVRLNSPIVPVNVDVINHLIERVCDFVTRAINFHKNPVPYYLVETHKALTDGTAKTLARIADIRTALLVQLIQVVNRNPDILLLYLGVPCQWIGSRKPKIKPEGDTFLVVEDPDTVACYRILLASVDANILQNVLLPIIEASDKRVILDQGDRTEMKLVRGYTSTKAIIKAILLSLSLGIIFDPHAMKVYTDERVFLGTMRVMKGKDQLSVYYRRPLVIEELLTIRAYLHELSNESFLNPQEQLFEKKIIAGPTTNFFYMPPHLCKTIDSEQIGLEPDPDPDRYMVWRVEASKPFDFTRALALACGVKVHLHGIDKKSVQDRAERSANNFTRRMDLKRIKGSDELKAGMDLTTFTALEELIYTDESSDGAFLLPKCPKSLKKLVLTGEWTLADMQKLLEDVTDLELSLRGFDFKLIPNGVTKLQNVSSLFVHGCKNTEHIKNLDFKGLQRISVPMDHFPQQVPPILVADSSFKISRAEVKFETIEYTSMLEYSEIEWKKVRVKRLVLRPYDVFARRALELVEAVDLQEIVLKDLPGRIGQKGPSPYKHFKWQIDVAITLGYLRGICTKEEIEKGSVHVKQLEIASAGLATCPKAIHIETLRIDLNETDSIDSLQPGDALEHRPERVECYPNMHDLTPARIQKLQTFVKGAPMTIGPKCSVRA